LSTPFSLVLLVITKRMQSTWTSRVSALLG
jgi:hypothetical protein